MAKLSEKHPRESEIAKKLLEPYRLVGGWASQGLVPNSICLNPERADDLEMKICEALVQSYHDGTEEFY